MLNSSQKLAKLKIDDEKNQRLLKRKLYLFEKLSFRPFHHKSILELVNITYELKDYQGAISAIKKTLSFDEIDLVDSYLKLGRCYFRIWIKSKQLKDLEDAFNSYQQAFRDPLFQKQATPLNYFELATILLRLGKYQTAIETLNTISVMNKESRDWNYMAQYNIAQLLILNNDISNSYELYQRLIVVKLNVDLTMEEDNIVILPTRVTSILLSFEMARLMQRKGNRKLSLSMFQETWDRMIKYSLYEVQDGEGGGKTDLRFGKESFTEWFGDHNTFRCLGAYYRRQGNLVMSSEFSGLGAEVASLHGWEYLSKEGQVHAVDCALDRGEALAEVCSFELAESCASYAFERLREDVVVLVRASRCCEKGSPLERKISSAASSFGKAVHSIQHSWRRVMRKKRRKVLRDAQSSATKISAMVRMALTRNRLASLRLEHLSIFRIIPFTSRAQRCLLRSGREQARMWLEMWTINACLLQRALSAWLQRRRRTKLLRGILSLQRVVRGQLSRLILRNQLYRLQLRLNSSPSFLLLSQDTSLSPLCQRLVKRWAHRTSIPLRLSGGLMLLPDPPLLASQLSLSDLRDVHSRLIYDNQPADTLSALRSVVSAPLSSLSPSLSPSSSSLLDPFVQWLPFSITPQSEVVRLLYCSSLTLSSPSLGPLDCLRLARILRTNQNINRKEGRPGLWEEKSELVLRGSSFGSEGLRVLLSLGISHLTSLSFHRCGLAPSMASLLGHQLRSPSPPSLLDSPRPPRPLVCLRKLSLEGEERLGERGFGRLLSLLQLNSSLEQLSLRSCALGYGCIPPLCRLVVLSSSLKLLSLDGNRLGKGDLVRLVRCLSHRGGRGPFSSLSLRSQSPSISTRAVWDLSWEASRVGAKVSCDWLSPEEHTELDMEREKQQESFSVPREVYRVVI